MFFLSIQELSQSKGCKPGKEASRLIKKQLSSHFPLFTSSRSPIRLGVDCHDGLGVDDDDADDDDGVAGVLGVVTPPPNTLAASLGLRLSVFRLFLPVSKLDPEVLLTKSFLGELDARRDAYREVGDFEP